MTAELLQADEEFGSNSVLTVHARTSAMKTITFNVDWKIDNFSSHLLGTRPVRSPVATCKQLGLSTSEKDGWCLEITSTVVDPAGEQAKFMAMRLVYSKESSSGPALFATDFPVAALCQIW